MSKKDIIDNKDIYFNIEQKNKKIHQKNNNNKNIDKMIYLLSDKKDKNSLSFFKTFIYNNASLELPNYINSKKLIKVNTDHRPK